jgi:hypothetical protein
MRVFEPLMRHMDEKRQPLFDLAAVELDAAVSDKVASTMRKLVALVRRRTKSQRFGVIIDETQKITEAVDRHDYFKEGWCGWQYSPGNAFVRMDIASSHGALSGVACPCMRAPYTWSCCVGTGCAARVATRELQRLLASHVAPLTMYCCARCCHSFLIYFRSLVAAQLPTLLPYTPTTRDHITCRAARVHAGIWRGAPPPLCSSLGPRRRHGLAR